MSKLTSANAGIVPTAFRQHSAEQSQRTVQLTEQAIAHLKAKGQSVTLAALAEATRAVDEHGKGITSTTILRNAHSRELFQQHSPAYQQRQQRAMRSKHRHYRAKVDADLVPVYRRLRAKDLIGIIEELKQTVSELKAQQSKLRSERDEAYRLRDEVLHQNARQLAALTKLQGQSPLLVQRAESPASLP